jgi:hypothetical protein
VATPCSTGQLLTSPLPCGPPHDVIPPPPSGDEPWGPVSPHNVHETGVSWMVWIPPGGRRGGAGRANSKRPGHGPDPRFFVPYSLPLERFVTDVLHLVVVERTVTSVEPVGRSRLALGSPSRRRRARRLPTNHGNARCRRGSAHAARVLRLLVRRQAVLGTDSPPRRSRAGNFGSGGAVNALRAGGRTSVTFRPAQPTSRALVCLPSRSPSSTRSRTATASPRASFHCGTSPSWHPRRTFRQGCPW